MGDAIDAQNNDDVDDEYDRMLDMIDALENEEAGTEVGLSAALFAARILDSVADLSGTERSLLTTAVEQTSPVGWDSALAAFKLLYLRVRESSRN